jgi:hypothetical protein
MLLVERVELAERARRLSLERDRRSTAGAVEDAVRRSSASARALRLSDLARRLCRMASASALR